jgi:sugar phosphate isomerase/epimerase
MVREIRLFEHDTDRSTQLTSTKATGRKHFRFIYEDGKLILKEKLDSSGLVTERTAYNHVRDFIHARHFDHRNRITNVSYQLNVPGKEAKVVFDTRGQVISPIQTQPETPELEVMVSLRLDPDFEESARQVAGQNIQLYLPRLRELYGLDNNRIRGILSDLEIGVSVIHSPAIDVTRDDFVANLAWMRGNYGADTLVLHPQRGSYGVAKAQLEAKGQEIREIGVDIAYENLDTNERWLTDPRQIVEMGLPYVSSTLDLSHLPASTDLIALTDQIFEKLSVVHLSNQSGAEKHMPYRQGSMPVEEFLRMLRDRKYTGRIVLEYKKEYREEELRDVDRVRALLQ